MVNEVSLTIRILVLHLFPFGFVVEGKNDLANGGRLLVFPRIYNEALKEWVFIQLHTIIFEGDEVDVWLNFP